jgi:dihydropteroate synthase
MRRPIEEAFPPPAVVGIVNVTPDSFSGDGVVDPAAAVAQGRAMLDEGAALVDVGGESTRPGSASVPLDEELRRVLPVLEGLSGLPVSIDTSKAEVARRALALGALLVNDVTALRSDSELVGVVAESDAYLCLMHMRGEPRTMQENPRYDDVVADIAAFLEERLAFAIGAGVPEERICLDPGIGFGKTVEHNLELIARLDEIRALGRPVLVGASRKRFTGRILGDADALTGPLSVALAMTVLAYERGASLFRVHEVRPHVEALTATEAVEEVAERARS